MSDDPTPKGVRRATVTLRSEAYRVGWTRVTDETGTFNFAGLPAGRYTLAASKPSFVTAAYGALRPGRPGSSIVVIENGHVTNLTLTLLRGAAITGVVRDASGLPMENVQVSAGTIITKNGVRATSFTFGGQTLASTDDRGEYRLYGLAPGEYAVAVESRFLNVFSVGGLRRATTADIDAALRTDAAGPAAATPAPPRETTDLTLSGVYYPGTARLDDAQPVKLAAAEERRSIDIQLEYVPAVSIEGRLLGPDGKAPVSVTLNLLPSSGGRSQFGRPSPADGTFAFTGVTPGRYVIAARAAVPGAAGSNATLYARADVEVTGSPVKNVNLTLKEGATVSGTVSFDSASGTTSPGTARVALVPILTPGDVSLAVPGASTAANGVFSFVGVTPGRYRVTASSLPVWTLKSAVADGEEVVDDGFEVGESDVTNITVKMSDQVAEVVGILQDASGRPAPDYYVIVFPTDTKYWIQNSRRIKTARPGNDGKYILRDLPPGEYRIAAVTDVDNGEWFEPAFLQQLVAASATLTLTEGEKKSFPLKIGGG